MKEIRFESMERENIIYLLKDTRGDATDDFYRACHEYTRANAFEFDTLGDGGTQHTQECHVSKWNALGFCSSLVSHLADNPDIGLTINNDFWRPCVLRRDQALFFAKMKHNPDKRRWYNKEDLKVSAAESKGYDKRWNEVPTWADGSVKATYSLLGASYLSFLDRVELVEEIRNQMDDYGWVDYQELFGCDRDLNLDACLNIIRSYVTSNESLDYAQRATKAVLGNLSRRQEAA